MYTFHKAFYHFVRFLVRPYFYCTNYRWHSYKPKSKNYLVLTNHTTNWDFFLSGLSLPYQMYFVASEHILRMGWKGKAIKFLVDPIPRKKGASGSEAARLIAERLQEGKRVCMFVEGSRTFNGATTGISPNNAKLVKQSGASLITFRVHGGYLVNPRWSNEKRKGPSWGEIVHEYSPEELAAMTDEELNAHILEDIYVDAFEDQKTKHARYTCKHPAEHLERALYVCPKCHSFSTLESHGETFDCKKCGTSVRFDEYGFFQGKDGEQPVFSTVLEWDKWQISYLKEYLPTITDPSIELFGDDDQILKSVHPLEDAVEICRGRLSLHCDRLAIGEMVFPISKIDKFALSMSDTMLFTTTDGKYYEIRSPYPRSSVRYQAAVRFYQGKDIILR